eukprot:scaffold1315_cov23-Cyclotella_meneghiniana.AAC.11
MHTADEPRRRNNLPFHQPPPKLNTRVIRLLGCGAWDWLESVAIIAAIGGTATVATAGTDRGTTRVDC